MLDDLVNRTWYIQTELRYDGNRTGNIEKTGCRKSRTIEENFVAVTKEQNRTSHDKRIVARYVVGTLAWALVDEEKVIS